MAKLKAKDPFAPEQGPVVSIRFVVALVLMVAGVAWVLYTGFKIDFPVKDDASGTVITPGSGWKVMQDLGLWSYLVGFGAFFLGLIIAAHPSTPLGRGRGVVGGMLGCFLVGLAWICVFYAIANSESQPPIFDDLQQKNLFVGIAFMAVGFTFATRWE